MSKQNKQPHDSDEAIIESAGADVAAPEPPTPPEPTIPEPPAPEWRLEIVLENAPGRVERVAGDEEAVRARMRDILTNGLSQKAGSCTAVIPPGRIKAFQYRQL